MLVVASPVGRPVLGGSDTSGAAVASPSIVGDSACAGEPVGGRLGRASRGLATSPASSNDLARIAGTSTPPTPPLPRPPAVPAAMPASSKDLARIACTSTPDAAPASDRSARSYDRRRCFECWSERCSERDSSARARPAPSTRITALPTSRADRGRVRPPARARASAAAGARCRWPARGGGRLDPLLGQSPEAGDVVRRRDADIVNERRRRCRIRRRPPGAIGAPCAMPVML